VGPRAGLDVFEIALLEFTCVVASSFNTDSGEMVPYVQKLSVALLSYNKSW